MSHRERFPAVKMEFEGKHDLFEQTKLMLSESGFNVLTERSDEDRPWGFFLAVDESQAPKFIEEFFIDVKPNTFDTSKPMQPKILGIAPRKRLSLQRHQRRSEVWMGIMNPYFVVTGNDIDNLTSQKMTPGQLVTLPQGTIHRGVGTSDWALIAEIWQHTDPNNLSTEEDNERLQDDFNRS